MRAIVEFGLDTFGDVTIDENGNRVSHAQSIRNLIDQAVLADELGLDFFAVGEHHRDDFAVSAPEVVLSAVAARTRKIHLGTAVTVLSSDDPVRVFERFSTLNAISNGRAEVILGRGSFTESFPLFGFNLADYEQLFEEKLDLFSELLKGGPINWVGNLRPSISGKEVFPPIENGVLRTWIGVGGTPESVVRAAKYGLPLVLAIIGGAPARFAPFVDLFYRALEQFGHPKLPVAAHSPGHVAATDEQALDELYPHFKANRDRIGAERGWPPLTRDDFEREAREGALFAGSPETVAKRIAQAVTDLSLSRFDLKYSNGTMQHEKLMESIRLYGTEVVPRVKELLAKDSD